MQPPEDEQPLKSPQIKPPNTKPSSNDDQVSDTSIIDVSGKILSPSLSFPDTVPKDGELYVYRNVFNLLPESLSRLSTRLKTIKFFANEINLFPAQFRDCVELQCLQIKVASSPGLSGLLLSKLTSLKELELSKAPPRPSGFPILAEIVALRSLTKLSVCHYSIRYLPPEIGCLYNLEYLDLSFNKMRSLPEEIRSLSALISLKVANNKLVELPAGLSCLQRLESLDLSRNRLMSLGLLDLSSMVNLRELNLQYNKLLSCKIPEWICCNLDGNNTDICSDDIISSSVEMDVFEATTDDNGSVHCDASSNSSSYHLPGSLLSDRCFMKQRLGKRWKRRQYLQQRARQERLNHCRKWRIENNNDLVTIKSDGKCGTCNEAFVTSELPFGCASDITCVKDRIKSSICGNGEAVNFLDDAEDDGAKSKKVDLENFGCAVSGADCNEIESGHNLSDESAEGCSISVSILGKKDEESSSSEVPKSPPKYKRQSDIFLDNPKPRKSRRSTDNLSDISRKYSNTSLCGVEDHLPDGFYDAGRDRPFMSLGDYEQNLDLNSREVILLDRERDEELDAMSLSAQTVVSRLKKLTGTRPKRDLDADDNILVASWLALFVSDRFGGSDRSSFVERIRKDVSVSNYHKPFVCTCATGNSEKRMESYRSLQPVEDVDMRDMCEKSLQTIKARRNSVVVPIGTLQLGVCRHRAVLVKYLCDRMEPPVPCELIRGYLDFFPHAWNVILVRRGESWVRMIVDACRPHDIREETDAEYFCRYIPLSRIASPILVPSNPISTSCFPTISDSEEVEKVASSSLMLCKVGSAEVAAKVRTLEVPATSLDAIRKFECTCLGEVRILAAIRNHPCIVEMYGHKISSEWIAASNEKPEQRMLRSAIYMEYVRGGSLKGYIEKLSKVGEKHVPVHLALCIARDVASALKELHSKHIIHRDIKSENILIDLEQKTDGPIVKLSDFDSAVPLRASLHSCCISHLGIPAPDICVGTPRWMAPEVLRTMNEHKAYGMEIDIWSYGCLVLELLTLKIPYIGLPESKIHDCLQNGKRPPLPDELKQLGSTDESLRSKSSQKFKLTDNDEEGLRFLVDVFHKCTNGNPTERPTAEDLYSMLHDKTSSLVVSTG